MLEQSVRRLSCVCRDCLRSNLPCCPATPCRGRGRTLTFRSAVRWRRYATSAFPVYAELVPKVGDTKVSAKDSPSSAMMMRMAKKHGVYLIGGSVPEREVNSDGKEKIYNTCSKCSSTFAPCLHLRDTSSSPHHIQAANRSAGPRGLAPLLWLSRWPWLAWGSYATVRLRAHLGLSHLV